MKKFLGLMLLLFLICFLYINIPYIATTSDEWAYEYNEAITMPGENSIFIPGTGVADCFVIVPHLDQDAVDDNDIIYCEERMGENHPFVIGHNYRSMGTLKKTEVGQYIYLSVGGKLEIYQVVVSEQAYFNKEENDIISNSGVSIYDTCDSAKTLHMYTCNGLFSSDSRWIVLATLVSSPY